LTVGVIKPDTQESFVMPEHQATDPMSPVMRKTAVFVLAGVGMLLLGGIVQPRFKSRGVQPEAERLLFPEFADADKSASLEIVTYDDALATLQSFKVVKAGGVWVLPSHQNYPADAQDHLAVAATELIDRPILKVMSTSPADHETYGVIEPDADKLKPGMTGIGQLVEIRDASGTKLARLIIGKEDKPQSGDVGAGGRTLRFVRRAGQDPVYRVEIDTSKFSSRFGDWIEKDLLKLQPWDVRRVVLDDYTLGAVDAGDGRLMVEQQRKSRMDLAYDDKDAKWSVLKLEVFGADKKAKEVMLAADEELASSKLTDLRNALGDLKIVDVARKPSGLSAELKAAAQFTDDPEAVASMQQRGFLPLQSGDILSTDGQTIVGMKDGVEYVLRFGAPTTAAEGQADVGAAGETGKDDGETNGRYLLVMARFNDDLLQKPQLDPLPDLADGAGQNEPKKKDEPSAPADEKKDGSAAEALQKADEDEAKAQAAVEERRRVERENRRKQEEYDEKVQAAQKRVRELNARFADWYYVVSDAECAKIRLDRDSVVQKKPADDKKE
jgi:hypothetical protein